MENRECHWYANQNLRWWIIINNCKSYFEFDISFFMPFLMSNRKVPSDQIRNHLYAMLIRYCHNVVANGASLLGKILVKQKI